MGEGNWPYIFAPPANGVRPAAHGPAGQGDLPGCGTSAKALTGRLRDTGTRLVIVVPLRRVAERYLVPEPAGGRDLIPH